MTRLNAATPVPSSEEQLALMRAVAAGDRQAFALLFKHFAPRIKSYLMKGGCAPTLAEELTQEAMVTLWRKAAQFDPARAGLSTWLFTVARNLRIDQHRRQLAEPPQSASAWMGTDEDGPPRLDAQDKLADAAAGLDDQLDQQRREDRLRQALTRLPLEQQSVLRLSYFEEQPHARIAEALHLPLGTVKSRIRLALTQLRRWMDAPDSADADADKTRKS